MNKNAIYLFTCHRPIKLESLILDMSTIQKRKYSIYIIDDSSKKEIIEENKMLINRYGNTKYLGISQYCDFYCTNDRAPDRQLLGDETWNLGIARNFALDQSTFGGTRKFGAIYKHPQTVDLDFKMNTIKTKYNDLAQYKFESLSLSTAILSVY
jgi:hypothetical protein